MELTTLEITKEEATDKLAEYEAALKLERNAEDEAIAMGYRAAARGLPLIRLSQAIEAGGFFDDGLPHIAITRATETECFVQWASRTTLIYSDGIARNQGALVGQHTVRVPLEGDHFTGWRRGGTIVPLIPPRHRPKPRRLKHCHILWEVESWTRVPPRDPALLRHVRGDLWAVLAVWDLTDLERYVLSQR